VGRNRARPLAEWGAEECEIAARLRRTLIEVILRMSEDLTRERARAAEQQDLLIAELNHRVRNILGLIRALVSQSQARGAERIGLCRDPRRADCRAGERRMTTSPRRTGARAARRC
jgi:light-regulated signal transduction histidine kinase (bacteriophytochrome)